MRQRITGNKFVDFLWVQRLLCLLFGHGSTQEQFTKDQQGYCVHCMKYLPGKAQV